MKGAYGNMSLATALLDESRCCTAVQHLSRQSRQVQEVKKKDLELSEASSCLCQSCELHIQV
jgi:hypothetical protein